MSDEAKPKHWLRYVVYLALLLGALPMLLVLLTLVAPPPACNPPIERQHTLLVARGARSDTWLRPLGAVALAAIALVWAMLAMLAMSFATLC